MMPFFKIGFGKVFKFVFSPINFEKMAQINIDKLLGKATP